MTIKKDTPRKGIFGKDVQDLCLTIEKNETRMDVNYGMKDNLTVFCPNHTEWKADFFKENEFPCPRLHKISFFLKNFTAKIGVFNIKISDDSDDAKSAVLRELERVLTKREALRVSVFRVICNTFDEKDITSILANLNEFSLERVVLVKLGRQNNEKVDLHSLALLPQWRRLKSLNTEFMMASSYWAHVQDVSIKVPVLERIDFTKLMKVLSDEYCSTKRVTLLAKHLDLMDADFVDIFDMDGNLSDEALMANQWRRGDFVWSLNDGDIEIQRQSE